MQDYYTDLTPELVNLCKVLALPCYGNPYPNVLSYQLLKITRDGMYFGFDVVTRNHNLTKLTPAQFKIALTNHYKKQTFKEL